MNKINNMRGLWRGEKFNGKWVYGDLIKVLDSPKKTMYYIVPRNKIASCQAVYPKSLGECTGLPDKNGKPIFEGDIVKYINSIGIIRFGQYHSPFSPPSECHLGFYVDWEGRDSKNLRKDLGYWAGLNPVIIIGNIHDNPELLKGGK